MTNIYNSQEEAELEKLNENKVLLSALKKVFLAEIYQNGILSKEPMENDYMRNFAFSLQFDKSGNEYARTNEDLGKAVRANNEALRMLSIAFQKIDKFKKIIEIDVSSKSKHR